MEKTTILGVRVDYGPVSEITEKIRLFSELSKSKIVTTVNTEFVVKAQKDEIFKDILNNKSSLNLPDGFGLVWAAKYLSLKLPDNRTFAYVAAFLQWFFTIIIIPILPSLFKKPIPDRIAGSDFIYKICELAQKEKLRIFLLGGGITVAERAALKLQTDIPDLRVVGVSSNDPDMYSDSIEIIKKSKADILLVAYGAPKQEKWLAEHLSKTGSKVGIGLGGTFNFVAGIKPRAPKWMQKTGLEWLHRLAIEPTRLGRQLAIPKFMWLVLIDKMKMIKKRS